MMFSIKRTGTYFTLKWAYSTMCSFMQYQMCFLNESPFTFTACVFSFSCVSGNMPVHWLFCTELLLTKTANKPLYCSYRMSWKRFKFTVTGSWCVVLFGMIRCKCAVLPFGIIAAPPVFIYRIAGNKICSRTWLQENIVLSFDFPRWCSICLIHFQIWKHAITWKTTRSHQICNRTLAVILLNSTASYYLPTVESIRS